MPRFLPAIVGFFFLVATSAAAREPLRVGWVEQVTLADADAILRAKIDTGAEMSSLDATSITLQKTGSHDMAVFSVSLADGQQKTFTREVKRYVAIKQKDGGAMRRPVVEMNFCIGGRAISGDVNLADRRDFAYPLLLGRNMIEQADLLVDVGQKFLTQPSCS